LIFERFVPLSPVKKQYKPTVFRTEMYKTVMSAGYFQNTKINPETKYPLLELFIKVALHALSTIMQKNKKHERNKEESVRYDVIMSTNIRECSGI